MNLYLDWQMPKMSRLLVTTEMKERKMSMISRPSWMSWILSGSSKGLLTHGSV